MIIHSIESLDLPGLEPYRTMRRPEAHVAQGIFVAEGEKVVRRLLASSLAVRSLLLTREWYDLLRPEISLRDGPELEVFIAPPPVLGRIVGFRFHQGIMAVGVVPREPSMESIVRPHLLVALEEIHHVENVGVIIRNAAGLGANGILIGETSCGPYLRRAVRNSMGAVFTIAIYHPPRLVDALSYLREQYGTRILAADPRGATPAWSVRLSGNTCLVVGNEDSGISPEIRSVADGLVAIPMVPGVDSLNVGSAAAALLYEAARQRTAPHLISPGAP